MLAWLLECLKRWLNGRQYSAIRRHMSAPFAHTYCKHVNPLRKTAFGTFSDKTVIYCPDRSNPFQGGILVQFLFEFPSFFVSSVWIWQTIVKPPTARLLWLIRTRFLVPTMFFDNSRKQIFRNSLILSWNCMLCVLIRIALSRRF